ncbi:MAG: sigma-54 dependent transcriptional regulator, partial [Thermodesulfobacteriota bacterium]|nr:sigma-54 dependent transcriptional regulator [Thermodesulfobacteriota bacterium]
MACVLIIDDDKMLCDILSRRVREIGHDVSCEMTLEGGIKRAKSEEFDVIFLDVQMPDGNGLDSLPLFQAMAASPEVIIITGEGRPDGAELAIKNGAWDYIEKASSIRTMILPLMRALEYRKAKKAKKAQACLKRDGIIGDSIRMKNALDLLVQAANSAANVLISGETGTGKELFSWAIHQNSPRASNNFIVVDCSALPDTLVESMLFGHEKGAFTSADRAREGLIQQADGGTLFLDEVGELPLKVQKVFLRAVQERRFRPIGGCREINSDFRIIAATNQDLNEMVRRGRFRKDLLFRLLSLTIDLPPLRERPEDIKELAVYHLARLSDRYGTARKGFSPEFFETLTLYDWPGNVRELFNSLEKALVSSHDEPILFP